MIEVCEKYRLGGVCLCLHIISRQKESVRQIEKSLIHLLPFRSSDCIEETLDLNMADFDFVSKVDERKTPFLAFRPENVNLINPLPCYTPRRFHKAFFVASSDRWILSETHIFNSVLLVATWWHVLNGGLCLHAAATSRNNQGFLFLGESGAGKSTVSGLSAELDIPVLAEDRVFLHNQKNTYILAAGPHQSTEYTHYTNLRTNLSGIFILVKDGDDYIKPIPHYEAAKYLFAALAQNHVSIYLQADALELAFRTIAGIARQIPVFELHFRKSPDFWRLIDEQFPD